MVSLPDNGSRICNILPFQKYNNSNLNNTELCISSIYRSATTLPLFYVINLELGVNYYQKISVKKILFTDTSKQLLYVLFEYYYSKISGLVFFNLQVCYSYFT